MSRSCSQRRARHSQRLHSRRGASLADLIRTGQREAVLAAITSPDLDVNAAEPDGSTPCSWATYKVDHELVRALLKAGAKANVTNQLAARSPLGEAAKSGTSSSLACCSRRARIPDSPNQDGQTALMLAASVGAPKVAELLIARGANVNAVETFRGQTALMWAAAGNHPEVVEVLLAHHGATSMCAPSTTTGRGR